MKLLQQFKLSLWTTKVFNLEKKLYFSSCWLTHWQENIGRTLNQIHMHACMKNGSVVLVDIKKSTGTFNLHKLYWYKARSALNWSPVVRLEIFGINFQTQLLLAHKLFQHVTLVSGGSECWPWGGLWRFLWSEQPVQWNRKHYHQCLYKGLLLWKTGGREGWGESMNLIYLFLPTCKGSA